MLESFGELLRHLRLRRGLTQESLAQAAEISVQAVGLLERNRRRYPRPSTVEQLAIALGCTSDDTRRLLEAAARKPTAVDQLPPVAVGFTGRENEVETLAALLTAGRGLAVPVAAVTGMGGIGKTALAVQVARRISDHFPDGHLFIDLRGFSRSGPITALDAVRQLLRALGVRAAEIPTGLEQATARYRTVMAERAMLVVLDNAAASSEVASLIPGAGRNAVLVTSRQLLVAPAGIRQIRLDGLPEGDAVDLLAETAGWRFERNSRLAREIVALCGYLPLAIRVAAAHLAGRPATAANALAAGLRDETNRLATLEEGRAAGHGGNVRNSIAVSVAALAQGSGESDALAVGLLPKLALLDGQDFSSRIAGRVGELTSAVTDRALDRLTDVNLLEASAPGRYRLHDLVAAYFDEKASADQRMAARLKALDGYNAVLWRLTEMSRRPPGLRESWCGDDWTKDAQDFVDREDLLDWLDSERGNLLATIAKAVQGGAAEQGRALRIGVAINYYCIARKRWEEWRDVTGEVKSLAADPAARGMLLADLGLAHAELHDFDQASDALTLAVAALEDVDHAAYRVSTLVNLSHVLERAGRQEAGLEYGRRSLRMARELGDDESVAMAALVVGMIYGARKDARQTESFATAVAAMRRAGPPRGLAMVFHQMGVSYLESHQYEAAYDALAESLRIYRNDNAVPYLPDVQEDLGRLQLSAGDTDGAVVQFNEALEGAIASGRWDREASVRTRLGEALAALGRTEEARLHLTEAVGIYGRRGMRAVEDARALLVELDGR